MLHDQVKIEGLVWGEAHKLVAVAFGVQKLVISAVIEDEKVTLTALPEYLFTLSDPIKSNPTQRLNQQSWPYANLFGCFGADCFSSVLSLSLLCYFLPPTDQPTNRQVGVEDITDAIEAFEDEVQSVDMTTMNRL